MDWRVMIPNQISSGSRGALLRRGPLRVKSTAGEVPLVWSFSVGLFPNGA
jgi:hypothetical protein